MCMGQLLCKQPNANLYLSNLLVSKEGDKQWLILLFDSEAITLVDLFPGVPP